MKKVGYKCYKNYWRTGLIMFVVGLMVFGGALVGLASSWGPEYLTSNDFDSGDFGEPDPSCQWLVNEYDFPDDCDLKGVKINDPITGTFKQQSGTIEYGCDATGFDVKLNVDGNTLDFFDVSGYTVYYVWLKAGAGGNLYGYPDGIQSDAGLISPVSDDISHVTFYFCEGEEKLEVSKTVETSFNRTHEWDIDKRVDTEQTQNGTPKIWLLPDGSGDECAEWVIDVTYEGFTDSNFVVSGTITITNDGDLDAVIVSVEDVICGEFDAVVEWPDGFDAGDTLAVGESITLTYSAAVDSKLADCDNVVTVNTKVRDYTADAAVPDWGEPDAELYKTVNIVDVSDDSEIGTQNFGPLTAEDGRFTYEECFAWADYTAPGPYFINNTATITETGDSASAVLKINWQDESLDVSKTVETSFNREHFWDIDKQVDTEEGFELDDIAKIWLYIDGSGDEEATWTVDVIYKGFTDSAFVVSGTITITNDGDLDAVIVSVKDVLCETIDVVVEWPADFAAGDTLAVGESITLTYSATVGSKLEDCDNVVTVTTEVRDYTAEAAVPDDWGDPDEEINDVVTIEDDSDLLGEVDLGSVTAPDDAQFTYTEDFAYEDYDDDCGFFEYDNTAIIVETEQSADATIKVNVQCSFDETAYAKGDNAECFIPTFSQWGWTNPIEPGEYEWNLWAGAAQCDTSRGILVGSVKVVYDDDGYVDVTFNVDSPYFLEETHVYAGYDMFPQQQRGRRTVDTVAPGLYSNNEPFDGSEIYVIAHAVVRIPDPEFGP